MRRLCIVVTVDPEIPVPPKHYGGIERIVDMLVRGLMARGHDVQLFANPASQTLAHLCPYHGRRSDSLQDTLLNSFQIWRYVRSLKRVDVIHSFGRLAYLLPLIRSPIAKIQSYQRHVTRRSVKFGALLANGTLSFTACSKYCASTADMASISWTVIPNGVPLASYRFASTVNEDAPLVFLGRVERVKGAHTAMEVARRAGRRLLIAGNRASAGEERQYFEQEIAPYCDARQIEYIGPVTDAQKNHLLGNAAALLFPIEWEEPFGIVMVEALACGTPVIAFPRGAVPEVIEHGVNGFLCHSVEEMVEGVRHIRSLDRRSCRKIYEERFSDHIIVEQYEQLYRLRGMNGNGVIQRDT